jgi:hypothetical protein
MWKKAETILYVAIGVSILADVLVPLVSERDHPVFWWHYVPGFDFVLGLVGCLLIIKSSKFVAKHWLQRPEDYYD